MLAKRYGVFLSLSIFVSLAQAVLGNTKPSSYYTENYMYEDDYSLNGLSSTHYQTKERKLRDEHRKNGRGGFSEEYRLYMDLLSRSNYSRSIRPVKNHLKPIRVFVGMCVMMIEDLIEREQTMVMSACLKMLWRDEFLQWDPMEYGRLAWLAVSSNEIWTPDIAVVNSQKPLGLSKKEITVGVNYDGEVGYFPSGQLATRCNLHINYFPFDWQNCEVHFESWIHPTQFVIFDLYPGDEAIDVKEYYENFQWSLKSYRIAMGDISYDNKSFSSITITFRLRRKPTFYFMYFIFPQFLLSALQTLSHTLPVEHPGRMSILTALFIGTSVTHAGIATHIPKSSDAMSVLQIYLTLCSCNLVIVLLLTFVMLYTVLRHPNKEPSFCVLIYEFFSIVWPSKEQDPPVEPSLITEEEGGNIKSSKAKICSHNFLRNSAGMCGLEGKCRKCSIDSSEMNSRQEEEGESSSPISEPPYYMNGNFFPATSACQQCFESQSFADYMAMPGMTSVDCINKRGSLELTEKQNVEVSFTSEAIQNGPAIRNFLAKTAEPKTPRRLSLFPNKGTWDVTADTSREDSTRLRFRRRWMQYCVALDKTFMYFNGLANVIMPFVLFYLMPMVHDLKFHDEFGM